MLTEIDAVCVDFYNTLVFHREGIGRGRALIEYLEAHGFAHAPWEHQVLYDVFDQHDAKYSPHGSPGDRDAYYAYLADRVFERLEIPRSDGDARRHAAGLWRILGPDAFDVFTDVRGTLSALRAHGYPIAIVSNWQRGLRHYCTELRLSDHLNHVVASGDVGMAKPGPGIFLEACARLATRPGRVLHVGDSFAEDYRGGKAAGLQVVLLQTDPGPPPADVPMIRRLAELLPLLGVR
ncbi:MAG: HAD family hydrolase [Gemmatimonadetes bacterium]|nr:HAD family hydrolase [Gemmatimonadota bacterium]